jgi:exopolysaccharide production protein ExoZ
LQNGGRFIGIQGLRFIAALMVVVTHTTLMIGERIYGVGDQAVWREGNAGVDIFFVISGFVMGISSVPLLSHPRGPQEFMLRRLMRIVPLYWVATTLKLVAVFAIPALTIHSVFDPTHTLASYFFLPHLNAEHEYKPLVGVGWTLTYEMFFYLLFAFAMTLRRNPLAIVLPVLVGLAALSLFKPDNGPAWQFYLDPILLEFGFGLLAAKLIGRGLTIAPKLGLPIVLIAFACFFTPSVYFASQRAIGWGIPAFVIVLCVAGMEPYLSKVVPKVVSFLGDSSYALYLFHSFYVPMVGVILVKLGWAQDWLAFVVSVAGSILVGALVHKWLEKPLNRVVKAARRPVQPAPLTAREA